MTLITFGNSESTRRCDAHCHDAKHPHCDCICGGKNHGVGLQQALENTREMGEQMIEKWKKDHPEEQAKINFKQPINYHFYDISPILPLPGPLPEARKRYPDHRDPDTGP